MKWHFESLISYHRSLLRGRLFSQKNNSFEKMSLWPKSLIWISDEPEVTIDGDQEQFIAKGEKFTLICRYNASLPASRVQWKKDGKVIAVNANKTNSGSRVTDIFYNESLSQLLIASASSQDSGNYICNVTNTVNGTTDSTSIVIQGMYTVFIIWCTAYSRHYFSYCSWLIFFNMWSVIDPFFRGSKGMCLFRPLQNKTVATKQFSRQHENEIIWSVKQICHNF